MGKWFANITNDVADHPDAKWQPFLQADGACIPLAVWFHSEQECVAFIDEHLNTERSADDEDRGDRYEEGYNEGYADAREELGAEPEYPPYDY